MQSFGDDTLLACLNVEKKHLILRETKGNGAPREQTDSGKYLKQNLLPSDFRAEDNVRRIKLSHSATGKHEITRKDESDIGKYFDDSVTFVNFNSDKNSSTSSASKKEEILIRQSSEETGNSHRTNGTSINTTYLSGKRPLNIIRESDEPSTERESEPHDGGKDTISNSRVAISPVISCTYDKESSCSTLSLPLCTQDRCKLASWGLPPNILQVSYYRYTMFNRLLKYIHIYIYIFNYYSWYISHI